MGIVTKNGVALSDAMLEEIAAAFEAGEWPGDATRIVRGRPRLSDEELQSVSFKDTRSQVKAMDERAASLGMRRSDYLRSLVARDLATA